MAIVTGSFGATGQSASFQPRILSKRIAQFNVSVWGTFVGTVQLERTFDSGTNWLPITSGGSASFKYTAPASEQQTEPEQTAQYRLNCTAYTSGTINYRLSQ
jgi:hypothetical protein